MLTSLENNGKEVRKEVSEKKEELAEAVVDFATAVEAACVQLKRYVYDLMNKEDKPLWNPDSIAWSIAEGPSGKYERAEDDGSTNFQNMVKDLRLHSGKLRRLGFFYWLFEKTDKPIVGRKKVSRP